MNQESQAVDSTGDIHALISYVPGRFTQCVTNYETDRAQYGRTFFLTRAANGTWSKVEIPIPSGSTQRSKLVFDRDDNAYVIMPFGRIVAATKASGWTDWTQVFGPDQLNAFGEVDVDTSRVLKDGIISRAVPAEVEWSHHTITDSSRRLPPRLNLPVVRLQQRRCHARSANDGLTFLTATSALGKVQFGFEISGTHGTQTFTVNGYSASNS